MKVGPAASSTKPSLVACCVSSSVGVELPDEDGSISGATRVSCSNALVNMLVLGWDSSVEDDPFVAVGGRGPRRSL